MQFTFYLVVRKTAEVSYKTKDFCKKTWEKIWKNSHVLEKTWEFFIILSAWFSTLHVTLSNLHLLLRYNNEDDKKKDASKSYV